MGNGTNGLTFNTLRDANIKRLPLFKDAKGRYSHPPNECPNGPGSNWSLGEWTTAVTGELGELANLIKKVRRGDFTLKEARSEIAKELADVQTYLDILAFQCGVDLGQATMDKWNEVSERIGAPIYIDAEDWHYTDEQAMLTFDRDESGNIKNAQIKVKKP